ncbi:hypothetical protein M5K25_018515 [Dendrobium thyrsiflorum]|uniref:Uncharacterized protein n=1 Tax=Dendrobium thyrsiflorum TaxID=117978 RepID=A0ABD0UQD2_DENTH
MTRSRFLVFFLLAILLSISYQGYGRRVKILRHRQEKSLLEEFPTLGRMMKEMTVMDYQEPGPNTNPRSGPLFTSPPPSPPYPSLH